MTVEPMTVLDRPGPATRRSRGRGALLLVIYAVVTGSLVCAQQVLQRDWPSERPPRPLEARPVPFPPYEIRTLANGLTVVVVRQNEQPAVSLRLLVRAGSAQDPDDKPGVATMVATLLDQGTKTKSAAGIADAIDFMGGGLGAGAGTDLSYANAILLKSSFNTGLDLLAEVVRQPAFSTEELDRQREQLLSGLKVSYQDPDFVANVVAERLIFGFHPYGKPSNGTPESVTALTRQDLETFHRRWYHPNNALLAIVGDVGIDDAFAGAERVFGNWARGSVPAVTVGDPPEPTRRVVIIDRPNAVQTEIRVGQIAIKRNHDDYMPLNLAVKILGGEGGNRLQGVLRSERGLTYGASADMDAYQRAGAIVAETDTRTETTAEALRLTVDEFFRLQREPVSQLELGGAQAFLAGNFPLTIETPDAIALQVLNALFYGLDLKDLPDYPARVNRIAPEDIQRVARAYLRPSRLSVVLVGDASKFMGELKGAGFETVELIKLEDLDLTAVDLKRGTRLTVRPAAPE